jgi:glycosyltransferase involved in cell wall biosynthesis
MTAANPAPEISLVIPLLDERESLPELAAWIERVLGPGGVTPVAFEAWFIDDGSSDGSWDELVRLQQQYTWLRAVRFRRNYGKSAALNEGFSRAEGRVVITLDADLQDSPDEIPALYSLIVNEGYDLVSGWKQKRYDPISKTVPSKLFNAVARWTTGIQLNDFNSGLKAYRSEVVKAIEVYGEMHRYIPFLAKDAGFGRIGERVVEHRARKFGKTKFGLERFVNGFLDLLTLTFVLRFRRKPMHFFGTMGLLASLLGAGITGYLIVDKLMKIASGQPHRDVVEQPLFFLALVAIILGVQLFLAGFLGELIARTGHDRNQYVVERSTH